MASSFRTLRFRDAALGLACLLSFACGSGDDDPSTGLFIVRSTSQAVAASTPVAISDRYVAYLASEGATGGGTMFNGDADIIDAVAFVVNAVDQSQTNVGVAAEHVVWAGTQLYLVVDEEDDEVDWDGDGNLDDGMGGPADRSLVHWSPTSGTATFVARLATDGSAVHAVGSRLFVRGPDRMAPGMGMTNLMLVEAADPLVATPLGTTSANPTGLRPQLIGGDSGLLFVTMDESADGELNGDGDTTDNFILGLVDGTRSDALVHSTGLAVADASVPFRALSTGTNDWLVGFLASEAAAAGGGVPGFTGFNDRDEFDSAWEPPHCGVDDTDTADDVLHYIQFANFVTDMVGSPPVNTGLVGVDRVVCLPNYVGTISLESDDGGCDLNLDGDTNDRVVRWVEVAAAVLPPGDPVNQILAVPQAANIPGGTFGFAELSGRFVIVVDEAEDGESGYEGDMARDQRLVGWYDPATSGSWRFEHGTNFFAGATWLDEVPARGTLLAAAPESISGTNFNNTGDDADTNDSIPAQLTFTGEPRLRYGIVRVAVDMDSAGMVQSGGIIYYRVSEGADTRDWNGDGDMSDFVLVRTSSTTNFSTFMGTLNNLDRPAIAVTSSGSTSVAGAFIAAESLENADFNTDGDSNDFVVRYFRL